MEHYRELFNSIDVGLCVIELIFDAEERPVDYQFIEVNKAFSIATGLTQVVGRMIRDLAPDHEQHWFDIYGRVAITGKPIRFEQEARALERWFSVYAFRIGGPESRKIAVLFEDITTRKRGDLRRNFLVELSGALAPLRDEESIIRTTVQMLGRLLDVDRCYFVESLPDEDRLTMLENYVRPGTQSIAGEITLTQFGGMDWWDELAKGNFAVDDITTHPLTKAGAPAYLALNVHAYLVQPFKEGGRRTVILAVTESHPRAWNSDELKLVEDVAARVWPLVERVRSERALAAAHAELERRVVERTAKLQETISELEGYSYSISHDLRAPLRAMQTYASIVMDDHAAGIAPEGREFLRRIMTAAERMDRLIRDVLVFSRVARGEMPTERIELGSFISGVLESYPGLGASRAEIEVVAPLIPVSANPAALTQCVSNLLGNAIKFTAAGVKPRIRIWSEARGDRVRIFFRDNGVGIAPEVQAKIFGMFYQVDPTREGTGVGLAVVRKAAERMGGAVGLTSNPDEGSMFWLELPSAIGGPL